MLSLVWNLKLWTLLSIAPSVLAQGSSCGLGKFGYPNCEYQCHCTGENNCNEAGQCLGGSTCQKGWFGPACQYEDVTATLLLIPGWINDNNDATCNIDPLLQNVWINLTKIIEFSWLRINVNLYDSKWALESQPVDIQLEFSTLDGEKKECKDKFQYPISSNIFDIQCDVSEVSSITISGKGIKTLCGVYITEGKSCPFGWFGYPSCKYKCHCTNGNDCNDNGDCLRGSTCERGWFGPACQYVDLAYSSSTISNPPGLFYNSESTCNEKPDLQSVDLTYRREHFLFTWLRLKLNRSDRSSPLQIQLNLITKHGDKIDCRNSRQIPVSDNIVDIQCDPTAAISKVNLSGHDVRSICYVWISGGRNVALKQNTKQSSTFESAISSKLVDGNSDYRYIHSSCSNTQHSPTNWWELVFNQQMMVNRIFIQNRCDCCQMEIVGFKIQGSLLNEEVFASERLASGYDYYNFANVTTAPINWVRISNEGHNAKDSVLHLCEVQIFGDTFCSPGKYGRECELSCFCANKEICHVSTGACPSGCADGYGGISCDQPCAPGKYGSGCSFSCSQHCLLPEDKDNQSPCHHVDGHCLNGCSTGYSGQICIDLTSGDSERTRNVGIAVGVSLTLILIITAVIVTLYCRKRQVQAQNELMNIKGCHVHGRRGNEYKI